MRETTTAEAAAEVALVDDHFLLVDAKRCRDDCQRTLGVLRGRPELGALCRHVRGAVLRLHRCMSEVGDVVFPFDALGRGGQRGIDIPFAIAIDRIRMIQTLSELRSPVVGR